MGSSVILPSPGQPAEGPDAAFKSAAIPNVVSFGFEKVTPPTALYIQRDDVLVIHAITQQATDTVTVLARLLIPLAPQPGQPDQEQAPVAGPQAFIGPGYIQVIQRQLALTAPRGLFLLSVPLMEGYLLSLAVLSVDTNVRGMTFVRAFLSRGSVSAASPNAGAVLLADYTSLIAPVTWPGGRVLNGAEGPGFIQTYTPANPGAGADINFQTNLPGRVRLASFAATFTASAAVGNRVPSFILGLTSAVANQYQVQDTVALTASQVVRYSLAPGVTIVRGAGTGTAAAPIVVTLPLPSPSVGSLSVVVNTATQGILAGDQWSAIQVTTEEWIDAL